MELFKELARSESGHRNGLRRTIRTVSRTRPRRWYSSARSAAGRSTSGPTPRRAAEGKCPMCPGRFALRLDEGGDWTLERLAP